jgi:cytochrome c-type biogenesis protein CcmH/NrfG
LETEGPTNMVLALARTIWQMVSWQACVRLKERSGARQEAKERVKSGVRLAVCVCLCVYVHTCMWHWESKPGLTHTR